MGVHPFQISDLNWNFLQTNLPTNAMGSFASEFAIFPDNVNANASRYMKLQAVWANINIGSVQATPTNDSYGQNTGYPFNQTTQSPPARPNGGYFVRGLYFTNTAVPTSDATGPYRVGYIGSFVGGLINADYAHDPNGSTVDYETIYTHSAATWPIIASEAKQWRDVTTPVDGSSTVTNSSSALSRTIYMPPSYMILYIDSVGSNTLVSGDVTFHFENRPTLHMAGFNDQINQTAPNSPAYAGTGTFNTTNGGGQGVSYPSDPLSANGTLSNSATDNFHEMYQVTGVRKLNSRGLSFHLAKVLDNGAYAYAYPYEEDGITLGTGVTLNAPGGNSIESPFTYVNDQQEYVWAGGRDAGASITNISSSGTSVTFTIASGNAFTAGQIVLIQGLNNTNNKFLNGELVTVAASPAPTSTSFTSNITASVYVSAAETSGGAAVYKPDFRIRDKATFTINEEYYGTIMDTKCAIWSNKSSMIPLLFFDLADTWTASTAKRIAGVTVVPLYSGGLITWQIFFLSEDGKLAVYDFTQTNGVISLITSAPAVAAAGEAYGAIRTRSTTSSITSVQVTSNVVTVACSNTFEAGEIVNVQGLGLATFLNNQTLTVLSTGLSTSQFEANFTNANYGPTAETQGTAVGYSLWALYGTMYPDPRIQQTSLTNTANINLYRYLIGAGTWGSKIASPLVGRHNGRSISEMFVARDTKLYMLIEDVTVTGSFNVANSFGFAASPNVTPTNVNWQIMAYDPIAAAWNATKINGSTLLQYGTNFGTPSGSTFSESRDFWFQSINASLIDINPNEILVQPNWTGGVFQTLNVSGSTASLSNSNLSVVSSSTLWPGDSFIPSSVNPATTPVAVVHAKDFATNGERTVFWLNDLARSNNTVFPIYLAPPSFSWSSPTALSLIQRNAYNLGVFPNTVESFQKDYWSYSYVGSTGGGNSTTHGAWAQPVLLMDNYIHWIVGSSGTDNLPSSSTYGRCFGQFMGFLPTYWKWTGSAWTMADNWTDASTHPYTIPNANVNIPLPYGLQVQYGPTGTNVFAQNEFQTFNLAYGNTKFARKLRQSYATFGGQTFTNVDTRTIASQNALSMFFIDTDLGAVVNTAPTSATPQTASLTTPNLGWLTQTTWNKLDTLNVGFDATPFVTVWNANNNAFNYLTFAYPAAANVTGSSPGPYSWTANAVTYAVQASSELSPSNNPAWHAVAGSPQLYWQSNTSNTGTLAVDLGSAQTVHSYGFRPLYNASDLLDGSAPKSWTLQGSNTSLTSGFTIIDTQTNVTSYNRGAAFTVATPSSYRYYQMNITATQSTTNPSLSMLRLNTSALQSTVNFSEMTFYAYGSQEVNPTYVYPFIRNWQMARGIKLETSTTAFPGPYTYTSVFAPGSPSTPYWRALNGYVFTFPRQTGVTSVRITVQHGYNYNTSPNNGNVSATTGFGPFYFIDYGSGGQTAINTARLGNSGAMVGTPAAGSWDPNCLGIATDVPNISIDSANPSLLTAFNQLVDTAVHGFWDFNFVPDAAHSSNGNPGFKVHPFFGFVFFQGAGGDGGVSTQTGTNAVINYQWGRRV